LNFHAIELPYQVLYILDQFFSNAHLLRPDREDLGQTTYTSCLAGQFLKATANILGIHPTSDLLQSLHDRILVSITNNLQSNLEEFSPEAHRDPGLIVERPDYLFFTAVIYAEAANSRTSFAGRKSLSGLFKVLLAYRTRFEQCLGSGLEKCLCISEYTWALVSSSNAKRWGNESLIDMTASQSQGPISSI